MNIIEKVLELVQAVSEKDKSLSWEDQKRHTIYELPLKTVDQLAIIVADKLHNIRSIKGDLEMIGESV